MYVGTAAGFSVLHPVFAQGFMDGLGSTSMYSSASAASHPGPTGVPGPSRQASHRG